MPNQLQLTPEQQNGVAIIQAIESETKNLLLTKDQIRFITISKDRLKQQPELLQATKASVVNALKELALSNVEPTQTHAVLIVRENKKPDGSKVKECSLQWTAEGKKRAINVITEGKYYVHADVIYSNDKFEFSGFPKKRVKNHEPAPLGTDRGEVIGAYAVLLRKDDDEQVAVEIMTREEIEHIRDTYSETQVNKSWSAKESKYIRTQKTEDQKKDTVWGKEFAEMSIKTVIGRLHKRIKANINTYITPKSDLVLDRVDTQVEPTSPSEFVDMAISNSAEANINNTAEELPVIDIETPTEIQIEDEALFDDKPVPVKI